MSLDLSLDCIVGVRIDADLFIRKTPDPNYGKFSFNPDTGKPVKKFIEEEISPCQLSDANGLDYVETDEQDGSNSVIIGYKLIEDGYLGGSFLLNKGDMNLCESQIAKIKDCLKGIYDVSESDIGVYVVGFLS